MCRLRALALGGVLSALVICDLGGCDRTTEHPAASPQASPAPVAVTGALAQVAGAPQAERERPGAIVHPVLAWRSTNGVAFEGAPLVRSDGGVYVLSLDNGVYAYAPDGHVRWTYGADIGLPCAIARGPGDTVLVTDDLGRLHKLGPDGSVQWVKEIEGPVASTPADWPASPDGRGPWLHAVYPLTDGGAMMHFLRRTVCRVSPEGRVLWRFRFEEPVHRLAVRETGDAYAVSGPEWLSGDEQPPGPYSLTHLLPDGELAWTREVSVYSGLALSADGAPVVFVDDGTCELDPATGAVRRDPAMGWAIPFATPEPNRWLANWEGAIREWNGSEWRVLCEYRAHSGSGDLGPCREAGATLGADGSVYLTWYLMDEDSLSTGGPGLVLGCAAPDEGIVWRLQLGVHSCGAVAPPVASPRGGLYLVCDGILCRIDDASRVSRPVDLATWHNPTLEDVGFEAAWRARMPSEPTEDEDIHVAESGRVYVLAEQPEAPAQDAAVLVALEPDGSERWRECWGDFVFQDPAIAEAQDGSVWFRADGRLYWIPATAGDRWRVVTRDARGWPARWTDESPPIPLPGGGAVALVERACVAAVSGRGETDWSYATSGTYGALAFDGSVLYAAATGEAEGTSSIVGLRPDGQKLWSFGLDGGLVGLAVSARGGVVAEDRDGVVLGLAPDGTQLWRLDTGHADSWRPFDAGPLGEVEPERRSVEVDCGFLSIVVDGEGHVLQRWSEGRSVQLLPRTTTLAVRRLCTRMYPNAVVAWHYLAPQEWPGRVVEGSNGWLYVHEGTELTAYRPIAPPALPGEGEHR